MMLSWMQDRGADSIIAIGPPGAAKSMIAKAAGSTAGIPTVAFDLSAMQSSLVGGSCERLRAALQVVDAISQGKSPGYAVKAVYTVFLRLSGITITGFGTVFPNNTSRCLAASRSLPSNSWPYVSMVNLIDEWILRKSGAFGNLIGREIQVNGYNTDTTRSDVG